MRARGTEREREGMRKIVRERESWKEEGRERKSERERENAKGTVSGGRERKF